VQVVGHDHHGVDLEWARTSNVTESFAQCFHRLGCGENGSPPVRHDREEEGATRAEGASVLHGVMRVTLR
jgi:hypothetical protein